MFLSHTSPFQYKHLRDNFNWSSHCFLSGINRKVCVLIVVTSYLPFSGRQYAQTNREDEHWKSTQVDKWNRIIDPQSSSVTHSCLLSWYYSYLCSAWMKISELEEQATKLLLFLELLHWIVSVDKLALRFEQNFKEILSHEAYLFI